MIENGLKLGAGPTVEAEQAAYRSDLAVKLEEAAAANAAAAAAAAEAAALTAAAEAAEQDAEEVELVGMTESGAWLLSEDNPASSLLTDEPATEPEQEPEPELEPEPEPEPEGGAVVEPAAEGGAEEGVPPE